MWWEHPAIFEMCISIEKDDSLYIHVFLLTLVKSATNVRSKYCQFFTATILSYIKNTLKTPDIFWMSALLPQPWYYGWFLWLFAFTCLPAMLLLVPVCTSAYIHCLSAPIFLFLCCCVPVCVSVYLSIYLLVWNPRLQKLWVKWLKGFQHSQLEAGWYF